MRILKIHKIYSGRKTMKADEEDNKPDGTQAPSPTDPVAGPTLEEQARERVRAALLRYKPRSKPKFRRW
jgi:hypothetical protein